ncbi:MAG: hypothetical protein CVT63_06285 [Candidatus Anoxymicrobium japonicum]|uniref:DUF2971 domain-containing protein n=1 Tax=Candidatus Anoxymicrobium japonicum TaxID=2013648 RepID=A0A2N3G4X4_9ACTN|nr:MAG: hypothetical protein CVT63_06285 [Candidatus Anoxymicrobium japonicum]
MIYHYTSIHSLALILEGGKIRFNRLDRVDDVRESQTVAGIEFGKYFFVSCWTKSPKEHIPLWNMYTPNMKGVRIGLPDMPFKRTPLRAPLSWNMEHKGEIISLLSFDEMFCDTYCILPVFLTPSMFAGPVSYVPDMSAVYKENVKLTVSLDNQAKLTIGSMPSLPRTKDDYWAFQDEYRFALLVTPSIPVPSSGIGSPLFVERFTNHVLSSFIRGVDPGIDYYELRLDDAALNSIEVTLGPRADHGDRLLVEALLNKFTSDGKVSDSVLAIRKAIR